jgi:hypothetical protein
MNNRRRRITYRPSKQQSIFGGVMGAVFVGIGIFVVIPIFGAFGGLWPLLAGGITGFNLYAGVSKNYAGPEIRVEEDGSQARNDSDADGSARRLEELRTLYDRRLITQEEYEEKRKDILKEL